MKDEEITKQDFKNLLDIVTNGFEGVNKRLDSNDRKFESIDKKFEPIDRKFESIDKKFEQQTEVLLLAMQNMFEENKKEANDRFDAMVEHKNDDMRIYNDRYNENKDTGVKLGLRIDELEMRTGRLEILNK